MGTVDDVARRTLVAGGSVDAAFAGPSTGDPGESVEARAASRFPVAGVCAGGIGDVAAAVDVASEMLDASFAAPAGRAVGTGPGRRAAPTAGACWGGDVAAAVGVASGMLDASFAVTAGRAESAGPDSRAASEAPTAGACWDGDVAAAPVVAAEAVDATFAAPAGRASGEGVACAALRATAAERSCAAGGAVKPLPVTEPTSGSRTCTVVGGARAGVGEVAAAICSGGGGAPSTDKVPAVATAAGAEDPDGASFGARSAPEDSLAGTAWGRSPSQPAGALLPAPAPASATTSPISIAVATSASAVLSAP